MGDGSLAVRVKGGCRRNVAEKLQEKGMCKEFPREGSEAIVVVVGSYSHSDRLHGGVVGKEEERCRTSATVMEGRAKEGCICRGCWSKGAVRCYAFEWYVTG